VNACRDDLAGDLAPCFDLLRGIELFAELDDDQLAWVAKAGTQRTLSDGDVLFEDGDPARHFYVLLSGELLITKMIDGKEQVYGRHSAAAGGGTAAAAGDGTGPTADKPLAAHQYTGELPLLAGGGYVAKATAVGDTELMVYDKPAFLEMLTRFPQICRVLLPVLAWRIRSYEARASRAAMLEGLGTLAAGLAHELNNPAAAMVRAVAELRDSVHDLTDWAVCWGGLASPEEQLLLTRVRDGVAGYETTRPPRDELEAADASDEISDWLAEHGVSSADEIGVVLVDHGLRMSTLSPLAEALEPKTLAPAIGWLGRSLQVTSLIGEIAAAGSRIATLVDSTKAYTNLDRVPQRDVDLREGLEATLVMQRPKLSGVRIMRDYADLPPIVAYPSELNQVWTNLIDNAADALDGQGKLRICTRAEGKWAVVEICDNGPGIPPDVLPMLFQPFFTTKDVGKGTGLGLHLSRDIVMHRHNGCIDVTSVPGDTRFTVRLPLEQ
jgi:signal transduction histidine kinase